MPHVIFIIGRSYCGSTVFCYILGSLPGVAGVSESRGFRNGRGCDVCPRVRDEECPVLPKGWFEGPQETFYADLAERLGVGTLVTSDKKPVLISRFGQGCRVSRIVLFRSPARMVTSLKRHRSHPGRPSPKAWRILASLNGTDRFYRSQLTEAEEDMVFLDYDYFIAHKEGVLRRLCEHYSLTFDPSAIRYWEHVHHGVGGNWGAYFGMQGKAENPTDLPDLVYDNTWYSLREYDEVLVDNRWKDYLTPREIQTCFQHTVSQTYAQMVGHFMTWLRGPVSPSPK